MHILHVIGFMIMLAGVPSSDVYAASKGDAQKGRVIAEALCELSRH